MNVIDTKIPELDSQFRLRPCRCGCENVGYLQIDAHGQDPLGGTLLRLRRNNGAISDPARCAELLEHKYGDDAKEELFL